MFLLRKPLEELSFPSKPELIRGARTMVAKLCKEVGYGDDKVECIELAVGEALANAVEHGSPKGDKNTVRVRCMKKCGRLMIEVTDEGRWRPPARVPQGEIPLRGRGIPMMEELVDRVEIEATRFGTNVKLLVKLPSKRRHIRPSKRKQAA